MPPRFSAIISLSAVATLLAAHAAARQIGRTWGATHDEAARALPGDDLVPNADSQVTMAVTIDGAPEAVWPWLVQMGVDRAGLYTHTWVENGLLRLGVSNAETIRPEWQHLAVGDHIWFVPDGYPTPRFGPRVAAIEQDRFLACTMGDDAARCLGTWQFVLEPQGEFTRLLFRTRGSSSRPIGVKLMDLVLEPGYLYMEIGMMNGIAARAGAEPRALPSTGTPPLAAQSGGPARILVAVASAQGATREIATAIAAELRTSGIAADLRDAVDVADISGYDAVVLGSAIHTHHWLQDADQFVERHQIALRERPVWLFSSGMLAIDTSTPWSPGYPQGIEQLMATTGARGHHVFAGRRELKEPKVLWSLFARTFVWFAERSGQELHLTLGDYRDWDEIRGWTRTIATTLRVEMSRPAA